MKKIYENPSVEIVHVAPVLMGNISMNTKDPYTDEYAGKGNNFIDEWDEQPLSDTSLWDEDNDK